MENKRDVEQLKKSLKKCLCPLEKPLDAAQARLVIMKTHDIKGGHRIWSIAQKHPLTSCRFTMWKFCILMHKLLHEGHTQVLRDSLAYQEQLQNYAQYWSAQRSDHMAQCIAHYCQVLYRKLSFHQTYAHFSGNFRYEYEPSLDVNCSFQLCLDMCDYLEDLLHLQRLIFLNLKRNEISSSQSSKKGLCRLTALVTIIAECNLLYQHSVEALLLLHSDLSPDDISGLSARFTNVIHVELRRFFEQARCYQLSLNYLEIPELPMTVPLVTTTTNNRSSSNQPATNSFCGPSTSSDNRLSYEPSAPFITDFDD